MAQQSLVINDWSGAIATLSKKKDIQFSARFIKGLNPFIDPSELSPFAKPTKVSGDTILALPKWMADGSPWNTNRYVYDEAGNIYKETTGGVWSLFKAVGTGTVDGGSGLVYTSAGQGLVPFNDYLYYTTDVTIARYGKLTADPSSGSAGVDFLSELGIDVDLSNAGTGQTYSPPVAISEGATHKQTMIPTKEPMTAIMIDIGNKGSGNWTMTVHDSRDTVIASKTIANANLSSSATKVFTFSNPVRLNLGETYHFHLTSTVADGTIDTGTISSLEDCFFQEYFCLVPDTNFHPMIDFDDGSTGILVIGNERYLAIWDEDTFSPNKIIFPAGYKCWSLTKTDEYIIAGCYRGDDVDAAEDARLFLWDGISPTLNFSRPISMGAPLALTNYKNNLLGIYGTAGELYKGSEQFQRISRVPKLSRGKKLQVFPGAISTWQGLIVIGYGANTDDATGVEQGIYAWGNKDDKLPEVLAYMGPISTGTSQGTGLEIGMLQGLGKDLYIGWKDAATYGVDKIIRTDNPVAAGSWESRVFDGENPGKEKLAYKVIITFEPLASGESITPKYKLDRAAGFTSGSAISTVGATTAEVGIFSRFKEIEFGFDFTTSTTFVTITGIEFTYDDLSNERSV